MPLVNDRAPFYAELLAILISQFCYTIRIE